MADIKVELIDINGSLARFIDRAPKEFGEKLEGAVDRTADSIQVAASAAAPYGPDGEGLTPFAHIRSDIEVRGRQGTLMREIGIFDDPDQAAVALFNEYSPNHQPFLRDAENRHATVFERLSIDAVESAARALSVGE